MERTKEIVWLIPAMVLATIVVLSSIGSGEYGVTSTFDMVTYAPGDSVILEISVTEDSMIGIQIQDPDGDTILYDVIETSYSKESDDGNITALGTFTFRLSNTTKDGDYAVVIQTKATSNSRRGTISDGFTVKSPLEPLSDSDPDPEPEENPMLPIILGSVVISGILSLVWLSDRGRYFLFAFLFLPLYTRLKSNLEEDIFEHTNRGRIYQMIKESPGVTLKGVKQGVETGNGTTVYHLKVLERNGLIAKEGIHYYIKGSKPQLYHGLKRHLRPRERAIVNYLFEVKSTEEKEICAEVMESQSNVNRDLKRLISHGIVKRNKLGAAFHYSLTANYLQWIEESTAVDYHEVNRTCSTCNQIIPMKSALYCPKCGKKI